LQTFTEIFNFTGTGKADIHNRGLSLFKEIPKERTCTHAEITPHWCACLEWQNVSQSDAAIQQVVRVAIEKINSLTRESARCSQLDVSKIVSSARYVPSQQDRLAAEKISKYVSNQPLKYRIHYTSLSHIEELYQVSIITQPGGGHFEITCLHLLSGKFEVSDKDISRINKYGHDADCVIRTKPHLRPYCYCRKRSFRVKRH
jgi:hypothetical protein